jgi:hypothetical protein
MQQPIVREEARTGGSVIPLFIRFASAVLLSAHGFPTWLCVQVIAGQVSSEDLVVLHRLCRKHASQFSRAANHDKKAGT